MPAWRVAWAQSSMEDPVGPNPDSCASSLPQGLLKSRAGGLPFPAFTKQAPELKRSQGSRAGGRGESLLWLQSFKSRQRESWGRKS